MTMKFLSNIASQIARFNMGAGRTVNVRAIQFVMDYIQGKQKEHTLTESEIAATRRQIIRSWCDYCVPVGEAMIAYEDFTVANPDATIMEIFFGSETAGVVGGFDYEFNYDTFIADCVDVWDFNEQSMLPLEVWLPAKLRPLVECVIRKMGLQDVCKLVGGSYSDKVKFEIYEYKLVEFNAKHEFTTRWQVDLNGACCDLADREHIIAVCGVTEEEMAYIEEGITGYDDELDW